MSLEAQKRSIVKSITFRILVVASDLLIVYFVTHRIDAAIGIVVFTNLSSTTLYYLHERAWNHTDWGRNVSPTAR